MLQHCNIDTENIAASDNQISLQNEHTEQLEHHYDNLLIKNIY